MIISLVALLGWCFAFTQWTHRPIEHAPIVVVSSIICIFYLSAFLGILSVIAAAMLLLGNGLFLYSLVYFTQNREVLFTHYLTSNIVVVLLIMLVVGFIASFQHFHAFDEFWHWGPHAKIMVLNDGFATARDGVGHPSYPPGPELFYYFFYYVTGFSEGVTYVAHTLLLFAPFASLYSSRSFSDFRSVLFVYLGAIVLFMLIYHGAFLDMTRVYVDVMAAFYIGAMLILVLQDDEHSNAIPILFPIMAAFTLLRPRLLVFDILIICIAIADVWVPCWFAPSKVFIERALKKTGAFFFLLLVAWLIHLSWQIHLGLNEFAIDWPLKVSVHDIHQFLSIERTSYQAIAFYAFMTKLYWQFPRIIFLVMVVLFLFVKKASYIERAQWLVVNGILLLGFALYLGIMLLHYLFAFQMVGGSAAASFERYVAVYSLGWTFFLYQSTMAMGPFLKDKLSYYSQHIVVLLASVFVWQFSTSSIQSERQSVNTVRDFLRPARQIAKAVSAHTDAHAKMFIVWQQSAGFEPVLLHYALMPRRFNDLPANLGPITHQNQFHVNDWSLDDFSFNLRDYDYLLLAYADATFWKRYGALFSEPPSRLLPLTHYYYCHDMSYNSGGSERCVTHLDAAYLFKVEKGLDNNVTLSNVVQEVVT